MDINETSTLESELHDIGFLPIFKIFLLILADICTYFFPPNVRENLASLVEYGQKVISQYFWAIS